MATIKLMRDGAFAPCCFILARKRDDGTYDSRDESNTVLVQTDWDYPAVAQHFGWNMRDEQKDTLAPCAHDSTDGTVDCHCGMTASEFITAASMWMHDNLGAECEDPGYFG